MSWAERQHLADMEWRMERETAETVPCDEPGCEASPGERCRNIYDHGPLRAPAHWRRIKAAQKTP